MFLILEVRSPNAGALGAGARMVFSAQGGTIGRRAGNDWVLQDAHVSGRHARVRAVGGNFFLEDNESANGVLVNGTRLHAGEPFPLKEGDVVFIDPFEIAVQISATRPDAPTEGMLAGAGRPLAAGPPGAPPQPQFAAQGGLAAVVPEFNEVNSGFDDLLGTAAGAIPSDFNPLLEDAPPAPPPRLSAADLHSRPIIHDVLSIPAAAAPPPSAGAIPTNWDEEQTLAPVPARPAHVIPPAMEEVRPAPPVAPVPPHPARAAPAPVPQPDRPVASAESSAPGGTDLQALLRGAGVQGASLSPEVAAEFGQVLRIVIEGLMEVLRARGEIKNEFRLPQTTFKPRENNPLKFSVNVEDALHNLLVKHNPAYLGTTAAFEDAFVDVRCHQMAMLAGIRAGFQFMLQRFDPATLKQQFDSKPGRKIGLPFGAQGRMWEQYEEFYHEMTADADDAFRRLFGDQFGRAYEEQLKRLRASGRQEQRS